MPSPATKNHDGREHTGLGVLTLDLASGIARAYRFLQLRLAFSGAKDKRRHRPGIGVDDKFEPVRKHGLKHHLGGLRSCRRWCFRDDIEPIRFQPRWASD